MYLLQCSEPADPSVGLEHICGTALLEGLVGALSLPSPDPAVIPGCCSDVRLLLTRDHLSCSETCPPRAPSPKGILLFT